MSLETSENPSQIETVDVDDAVKENGTKSEISSDSGIETLDSHFTNYHSSSEFEISPSKDTKSAIDLEQNTNYQDALQTQNKFDTESDIPSNYNKILENEVINNNSTFDVYSAGECTLNCNANVNIDVSETKSTENFNDNNKHKLYNSVVQISNLSDNLTSSTASLNEQFNVSSNFSYKSNSRSAENISNIDNMTNLTNESHLEKDEILSQFKNQKQIISATQKIITENQMYDARYSRLPKEILSQDLGSIVKNVHGLFSSVSGSLKNAYNNSHKIATAKPPIKCLKTPNGKVMDDIFEDISSDKIIDNNIDKMQVTNSNINLNMEPIVLPNETCTDNDNKNDLFKLQVESLERVLSEQRRENASLRDKVKQQMDELQSKDQMFKEFEAKVDLMCKRAEQAQKEKDAAVMRYASVECAAIEAKKAAETATKAERAAVAERELLVAKLKTAREEKQRICQLYDDKCHELQNSEREVSKAKEELREVEGRLKWTQSKLRMEVEAYKECTERAEKLSQQVAELEAAKEAAAANATDTVRAKQLEIELKENQAALILCRHEKEDLERRLVAALQQLDSCKRERDDAMESLARANTQVEELKESNLRLEEEAAELAALRARAALADTLASQLTRETERASQAEEALSEERARAETCARREAAALEHAANLTAQHVASRACAHDQLAKAQALSADNVSLRERVAELQVEKEKVQTALEEERERRNKENRVLARKVAELTEEVKEVSKKLEWEEGENNVLKKKHNSAVKEMNRELQRALKRIEQLEAKLPRPNDADSTRTGSISSLSSGEGVCNGERAQSDLPSVEAREPDRQALIERIVSLQRAAARRAERCDFLEEHARALTAELRGKARLLRRILPNLPPAQLAPSESDGAKQEIARLGGGAMAAVWGGDPEGMTFELSLEINRRLQALLEDTLLKNITLKDNIDTLGEEIARLKAQRNDNK